MNTNVGKKKFLIIRAYPAGMCSCLMHVTNELLYAELTNRIPIVYWKQRSLYYENTNISYYDAIDNSFEYYYKPVSDYTINDVIGNNFSYFPAIWTDDNIQDDSVASSTRPLPYAIDFEGSNADVLVSSSFRRIEDLHKIIPKNNHLSGMTKEEIWHHFFNNYIFLKEDIKKKIDDFYTNRLDGKMVLGLHIRKTDKTSEQAIPHDWRFIKAANSYLRFHTNAKIFIATDCQKTLAKFKKRYREKLIYTDAIRGTDSTGVHFSSGDKRLKGEQILQDVYLLGKCNYFIGSLSTNIAYLVLFMLRKPLNPIKESTLVSHGSIENFERNIRFWAMKMKKLLKRFLKKVLSAFRVIPA